MVKITYHKAISDEHRAEIDKYLLPYLWLVPAWCAELYVALYTDSGDNALVTSIKYEYRHAVMDFYAGWLLERPEHKQKHVIHDLLHIATSVYVDYAEATIKNLCPTEQAEKFNAHLLEESRIRCESMVEDLARCILNRPESA